jgi:hypothetical protein
LPAKGKRVSSIAVTVAHPAVPFTSQTSPAAGLAAIEARVKEASVAMSVDPSRLTVHATQLTSDTVRVQVDYVFELVTHW